MQFMNLFLHVATRVERVKYIPKLEKCETFTMLCTKHAVCAYMRKCAGHLQSAEICPLFRGQIQKCPLFAEPKYTPEM